MKREKAILELSNGMKLEGDLIGQPIVASGEMVFTTSLVGYSESLSDPSYFGQILTFAYPLIGNYGIPSLESENTLKTGFESNRIHASAVIVTNDSIETYHWDSRKNLHEWLLQNQVPGIVGIDTRHLIQLIREEKQLLGRVLPTHPQGLRQLGKIPFPHDESFFNPGEFHTVEQVSTSERKLFGSGKLRIALLDFGVKWNIIRKLNQLGCEVELLPWDTDLYSVDCSGWLLGNGPGNPECTGAAIQEVKKILTSDAPILGICLGHQVLALAIGARTVKMPYGHRSHNQPVIETVTGKGYITCQNHGYVVTTDSLPEDWNIWFKNANDGSIEGLIHKSKPFRSVQFHPESAGGPQDTLWILENFVDQIKNR